MRARDAHPRLWVMGDAFPMARLKGLQEEAIGHLAAYMNSLVLVHADPVLTLAEISQPVQGSLHESQNKGVGDEVDNATVHQGMSGQPVPPNGEEAVLLVVNFVIAILAVAHGLRLQNEVREGMAEKQHEQVFYH